MRKVSKGGKLSVTFRLPKELSDKFEKNMKDCHLDRNGIVTLLLSKYITDQEKKSDTDRSIYIERVRARKDRC